MAEITAAGYQTIYAGQKTYNGVAYSANSREVNIVITIPGLEDPQKRVCLAVYSDMRVICIYVPNGERSDRKSINTN